MANKEVINGYTIHLNQELGSGNFATVYKAVNNKTKKVFAAKLLSKIQIDMDEQRKLSFEEEIVAMQTKSEHIVQFIEMFEDKQNYYIIQQLCDGNLRQYLKKEQWMEEEKAIRLLTEICVGIKALVRRNITHRDLKPENILLKQGRIKIADFGVSKKNLHNKCSIQIPAGSLVYMSLQALKGESYTSKADIWTIGLIFYELLHGQCPWYRAGDNQHNLIKKIETQKVKAKSILSITTKTFLKKCLQINEENRLDWPEFFSHPIFRGKFNDYIQQRKGMHKKMADILSLFGSYLEKKQPNFTSIYNTLTSSKQFLTLMQFQELLRILDPSINKHQVQFIFEETDVDKDGTVSIEELENRIFQSKQRRPSLSLSKIRSEKDESKSTVSDSQILSQYKQAKIQELGKRQKIRNCLKKMQSILSIKGQTIAYSFKKKSQGAMKMNKDLFTVFIKKYNSDFPESQINQIFNLLGCSLECAGYVRYDDFLNVYERATSNEQNYPRLIKKDTAPAMFSSFHQDLSEKMSSSCNLSKKDDIVYMSFHQKDQYSNTLGSFNKIKGQKRQSSQVKAINMMASSSISTENNSSLIKRNKKSNSQFGNGKSSIIMSQNADEWEV